MKILLAGDSHGNSRYMMNVFAHACRVEADCVFQLGDFGYGWEFSTGKGGVKYDTFTSHVAKFAKQAETPCYWLPGNHENYTAIDGFVEDHEPTTEGLYEFAPNVFYVPRGTVLTWDDKRILVCGGATSVDRKSRTEGKSWWTQEAITDDDVAKCTEAGTVDVLLAHDFPWECEIVDRHLDPIWGQWAQYEVERSRRKISAILDACKAPLMFHGHLHMRYTESIITKSKRKVIVHGLDRDDSPMQSATYLLDLKEN